MIYIVEDDRNIRELERYALQNSGFEADAFENASGFFAACDKITPELVLLDIMLPNEDGLSILKRLRDSSKWKNIPVIMVTAKDTEIDKVKGLDLGADDYITKPFGIMELISRVKALLRRVQIIENKSTLQYNNIVLNDEKRTVTADGKNIELTYKEYELLKLLLMNKGIVLSRNKIMEHVWGFDYEGESRTVDMHVKTLRQKLGECGKNVKTVRNVGYKIGD